MVELKRASYLICFEIDGLRMKLIIQFVNVVSSNTCRTRIVMGVIRQRLCCVSCSLFVETFIGLTP